MMVVMEHMIEAMAREDMAVRIITLEKKLKQTERERDAAVADIGRSCITCKHFNEDAEFGDGCDYVDDCAYHASQNWEWRGVPKEEQ